MRRKLPGVARVFVAAYVGALIAGPAPLGFVSFLPDRLANAHPKLAIVALVLTVLVLPWMISGIVAGRRLGAFAGLLGIVLFGQSFLLEPFSTDRIYRTTDILIMVGLVCAAAALGWIGGYLASRGRLSTRLDGWRHWSVLGIILLVLFVHTVTLGTIAALRAVKHTVPKNRRPDPMEVKARTAGVYVSVGEFSSSDPDELGALDTYYTDPTGLVVLFKSTWD